MGTMETHDLIGHGEDHSSDPREWIKQTCGTCDCYIELREDSKTPAAQVLLTHGELLEVGYGRYDGEGWCRESPNWRAKREITPACSLWQCQLDEEEAS